MRHARSGNNWENAVNVVFVLDERKQKTEGAIDRG